MKKLDYSCDKCEKQFEFRSHLSRHQISEHKNRKDFSCDQCEKKFVKKSCLFTHRKLVHKDLLKHRRTVHEGRKDYSCDQCEKKFGDQGNLMRHQMIVHEGRKDYECDKCKQKFGQKMQLLRHQMTVHEGRKDYACDKCEKKFGEKSTLIKHQRTVHEGRKDYACDKCDKKFGLKHHLLVHQRVVHEGHKDYACDKCEKKFGQKSCLLIHQKTVHEDIRDFACDKCDKVFAKKSHFFVHQNTVHDGRKDYACDKCERNFGKKSDVLKHQRTVHEGRKDYACDKCEKKFGQKSTLNSHQRMIHEGRKDHECDKCEKKFGQKWTMIQHRWIVHEGRKDHACDKCETKFVAFLSHTLGSVLSSTSVRACCCSDHAWLALLIHPLRECAHVPFELLRARKHPEADYFTPYYHYPAPPGTRNIPGLARGALNFTILNRRPDIHIQTFVQVNQIVLRLLFQNIVLTSITNLFLRGSKSLIVYSNLNRYALYETRQKTLYARSNVSADGAFAQRLMYPFTGNTHFRVTCKMGHAELVEALLNSGINENLNNGSLSKRKPSQDVLQVLLRHGVRPDLSYRDGTTLLIQLCRRLSTPFSDDDPDGNQYIQNEISIYFLIKHGANVNAIDAEGNSPIQNLFRYGYVDNERISSQYRTMEKLLDAGADLTHRNNDGENILHFIVRRFYQKNKRRRSKKHRESYDHMSHPTIEMVLRKLISEYNADVNVLDMEGHSTLNVAVSFCNLKATEVLLELGADPLTVTFQCGFPEQKHGILRNLEMTENILKIVEILKTHGLQMTRNRELRVLQFMIGFGEVHVPSVKFYNASYVAAFGKLNP
ncbi:unnamed protein product [Trichogramma brassicae]|uniref:C2H2-type domain-containing protein n=1 Tax=Trichogramma brassicae TaxID=86971 RepID=A0A6H5IYH1_9HYME|nr:unnamed protein product [Trichogramma brassicae]